MNLGCLKCRRRLPDRANRWQKLPTPKAKRCCNGRLRRWCNTKTALRGTMRRCVHIGRCSRADDAGKQKTASIEASNFAACLLLLPKVCRFRGFPVERKRIEYKGLYRFFERCKGSNDGSPECPAAPLARALRRAAHLAQKNPRGANFGKAVILRRSAVFPKPAPCPGSARRSSPKAPRRRF